MNRALLLSASVVLLVSISSAFPLGDVPASSFEEFKKILPPQVVEAYQNLSADEKEALKETMRNHKNYHNEQEFIEALKKKSPSLGARAEKLLLGLQKKISGLSAESRTFVDDLVSTARQLYAEHVNGAEFDRIELRQVAMGVVGKFRSLSPASQNELKETFPEAFKALERAREQGIHGLIDRFLNGSE